MQTPEDWDDWEDSESTSLKCLFCSDLVDSMHTLWDHCSDIHGIDMSKMMHDLTFFQRIQLVNFIRETILELNTDDGIKHVETVLQQEGPNAFDSPKYLKPVLDEDAVLYSLESDDEEDDDDEEEAPISEPDAENNHEQMIHMREQLNRYAKVISQLAEDTTTPSQPTTTIEPDNDTYYFDSYSHVDIHREMIEDRVRTDGYLHAIEQNKHIFQDKIVLDVGCGTGILSLFAARAGAAHVYAVDCSEMLPIAEQIVKDNNLSDRITLIKGKLEDIELPVANVDIIVSEWMGYCLLYESMLDSVLYARDKWLSPGGHMFPDKAIMFVEGVMDGHHRRTFWDNVYGFDMRAVAQKVSMKEGFVETISKDCVLTNREAFECIDIDVVKYEELNFTAPFTLRSKKQGGIELDGLAITFDVLFQRGCTSPVTLSTSIQTPTTHWKHIFFGFDAPVRMETELNGTISIRRNAENQRNLNVSITIEQSGTRAACTHTYLVE